MTDINTSLSQVTRDLRAEHGHGNGSPVGAESSRTTSGGNLRVVATRTSGKGVRAVVTCFSPATATVPILMDTFDLSSLIARTRFCAALPPDVEDATRREVATLMVALATEVPADAMSAGTEHNTDDIPWPETEVWHEPVDGAAVLDAIRTCINGSVVLPEHGDVIVTLWIAHTWAVEAFRITPYLLIESPTKMCGKTRTLDVLAQLAARPVMGTAFSVPVIFHYIEHHRATFLLDEMDATLANPGYAGELIGMLNVGSAKDGRTARMRGEGANMKPKLFSVFGPKALAGIGRNLPDATRSRCIRLRLERATPAEMQRLPSDGWARLEAAAPELRAKLMRFLGDNRATLASARPILPQGLTHRTAENWTSLHAIADIAGGAWPDLVRAAASAALVGPPDDDDDAITLLRDVRVVFEARVGQQAIPTVELIDALTELNGRWGEYKRGAPITPHAFARLLRDRFQLVRTETRGNHRERLWNRSDFEPLFARYLDNEVGQPGEVGKRDVSEGDRPASPTLPAYPVLIETEQRTLPTSTVRKIERDGKIVYERLRPTAHGDRWFQEE